MEPDIFGPAPRTFTFLNVNRCRLPAASVQGMNSYIDFTNQKSIPSKSVLRRLAIRYARCNNTNE